MSIKYLFENVLFWMLEMFIGIFSCCTQVAEMHGELMEFNEMLHRQLNSKEGFIRRLQGELVDLRGPVIVLLQLLYLYRNQ